MDNIDKNTLNAAVPFTLLMVVFNSGFSGMGK
jgi:hypothetical protein